MFRVLLSRSGSTSVTWTSTWNETWKVGRDCRWAWLGIKKRLFNNYIITVNSENIVNNKLLQNVHMLI